VELPIDLKLQPEVTVLNVGPITVVVPEINIPMDIGYGPGRKAHAPWSSPCQGMPELVKPKDGSACHRYNSFIVHDLRCSAIRNLVNAGAFQGELLCGLQAAKGERCLSFTHCSTANVTATMGRVETAALPPRKRDSAIVQS
jgi:hypothetical protein